MLVITGPNLELAKNIIQRTKRILDNKPFLIKESKATSLILNNDTIIQAQPSNHIDASRSFDDISLFLADEANFFIKTSNQDDSIVRNVIERYIGKTDPYILLVSTPYYPKGFFFDIGNEQQCNYKRFWFDYKVGLGKIYAQEEIEQQKTSPSFPSEYCLQWGMGSGDIFTELNIESYDLQQTSNAIISIDPAYGSSKFAIIVAENRNGVIHILSAKQYSRPTQTAMIKNIQNYLKEYTITDIIADSSNAGLITELKQYCRVIPFNFRQQAQEATVNAVKLMNEKKVMIHPHFKDLIQDLSLARFNNNGTVDKRIMNMDLFDSFIMAVDKLKQTPLKIFKLRNYGNNYRKDYRIE